MTDAIKDLILAFEKNGMLKFGEFTYKSGLKGPIYVDMRIMISHPEIMKQAAQVYSTLLDNLTYDRLGAIPYAGLPIVCAVALERNEPWIFYRKEAKGYGLGKMVEGEFNKGETVAVLDDLVNRGDSKLDAIGPYEATGLVIKDFVVLMDYGLGADQMLAEKGYSVHSAFTLHDVIETLLAAGRIDQTMFDTVTAFLKKSQM